MSNPAEHHTPHGSKTRLSIMMFLQFFLWGSWFSTLGAVLGSNDLAAIIGGAYGTAPIAAIIAPLFLGLIADRFFPSQIVMGVLFLISAGIMFMIPGAVQAKNGELAKTLILAHMLCYMPTLGLGNTISFSNLAREDFPKVRVWGTIGWIVAGLVGGFLGWSSSTNLFWIAGASALVLGAYCFTLPNTPPPAKGTDLNLRSLLMLDAFKMLGRPAFLVFILCSTLVCIPLAYYYAFTSLFLPTLGFKQAASSMTIGQMSEIFFMLLIPFFFRRLGVKWMILIGMGAWVARYFLFAFGAPSQAVWMLFAGIALHGICYDFFFVTGFMYTDTVADKSIRGQAQSMLVFFTQGVGMYFGYKVAGEKFGAVAAANTALTDAIKAATPAETVTFAQSLTRMFQVNMPAGIDPKLMSDSAEKWKEFWTLPAYMAAAIAVLFFVAFWDKTHDKGQADASDVAKAASPNEESVV